MKKEIKLRFTAQIKTHTGVDVDTISIDDDEHVQVVLQKISKRYGPGITSTLFNADGSYRNFNLIAVNQIQVNYDDNTPLNQGDELMLMSPIAGG
ncbi:hypothetical protein DHD05_05465 [Arenibacter sp. N53]|uniref:MoaD/ThiS family protein n=1 Tax=Arenibacter TaxID=178469 RepID=UPI000CD4734C|nr:MULTISPECIES: MoaD/ThiS family protein [Arenibacter]MCM4151035.1 hypothetical protein [Arenibacter sp. N53]